MPTLLVTGPGGAGTSTLSAALAVRAARAGRSAMLLSARPTPVGEVEGLQVVTVDPQRAFERLWTSAGPALSAALEELVVPPPSSVVAPPGTAELALLGELAHADADVVVIDAGPLDRALALLALPSSLRWWLEQALPTRLRMLGAVRTAAVRTGAVRPGPVDTVLSAVPVVEALLSRLALTDAARTQVRLVAEPRRTSVPALREAVPVLALLGQRPVDVHVRVLPGEGSGEWWAARQDEQARALGQLAEFGPVVRVPERPTPPEGADELAALLGDGGGDGSGDGPAPRASPDPAPVRVPGGWRLTLALPFARRGSLALTRWDDDLVVTLSGTRRSLRLGALLRRCVVVGGSLTDAGTAAARLDIDFAPDPGQWPADLLAAEEGIA